MTRNQRFCAFLVMALAIIATKTWALDESEITAMRDFYQSNFEGLNTLPLPWTSEPEDACGTESIPGWSGVACNAARTHIISISLVSVGLKGTIPTSIGGLTSLQRLVLSSCQVTGTIPTELDSIATLTYLDLRSNQLRMCDSTAPASGPATCIVSGQAQDTCVSGCCGCNAAWTAAGCTSDVPQCAACTGSPPGGAPEGTACSNGRWVVPGPYKGPLIVEGKALVGGDYELARDQTLIFVGWDSQLNVTGRATIRGAVVMYLSDPQIKELKLIGINRKIITYMTATTQTGLGGSNGRSILFSAHSRRACHRPSTITSGDTVTYTASFRYVNGCNAWWIILLCLSPTILGFLIGIPASFC